MRLQGKAVGLAMAGSHHTLDRVLDVMQELIDEGANITPIVSNTVKTTVTRHGTPEKWLTRIETISGKPALSTIPEVEPIGPKQLLDILVIAPCTGSTMARLANAITDSAVLMAAKSQLRNGRPVVLAITTNDALGLNAGNLARLLNAKNVYFVPFGQDNPHEKPNSLVAHLELLLPTVEAALEGRQYQPLLVPW